MKEAKAQAELLTEFYDDVFRTDNGQTIPPLPIPSVMMGTAVFTHCLVHKELSILDTSKSPGPDQLHPKFRKWLATFLAEPLADLFNNSLATAVVPGDWKAPVICPIFKKEDPVDVPNYRPVSLTSIVCKFFKRILKRTIFSFLSECKALTGCQHGFLPHRQCISNLG